MDVAVIDYGAGNLRSLAKALGYGGARVHVGPDINHVLGADAIVLPAAGAFTTAAAHLSLGAPALQQAIASGTPCLGICLGMQLLFDSSEEGIGPGMSALNGHVRRLVGRRVPHVGWNAVEMVDDPLFDGIPNMLAYYATSCVAQPADESEIIAWSALGNERFPAAVRRDNVWGVQFQPEKSGPPGLQLLCNFLAQVRG